MLVGGFLGAGKTTLILRASALLRRRNLRVGVILNDQDGGLVDTGAARAEGLEAREVAGGCFCCRFSDLMAAAGELAAYDPDVIFAEPVGSCMDLSATILQPLKVLHGARYRLSPLTVLLDPVAAQRWAGGHMDADVRYLFQNQLAEADLVCLTKQDLFPDPCPLPIPVDFRLCAAIGEGVAEWLREVLEGRRAAGARILDIDYDRYAEAEAALGWLNLQAEVELHEARSPAALAGPLLDELEERLTRAQIQIAHLKIFDRTASGWLKVGICTNGALPVPTGDLLADPERFHELAVNLRALAAPEHLEEVARRALKEIPGTVRLRYARAFRPTPPKPEYRFGNIAGH